MLNAPNDPLIEEDREIDEALRDTRRLGAGLDETQCIDGAHEQARLLALSKIRGLEDNLAAMKAIVWLQRRVRELEEKNRILRRRLNKEGLDGD